MTSCFRKQLSPDLQHLSDILDHIDLSAVTDRYEIFWKFSTNQNNCGFR